MLVGCIRLFIFKNLRIMRIFLLPIGSGEFSLSRQRELDAQTEILRCGRINCCSESGVLV